MSIFVCPRCSDYIDLDFDSDLVSSDSLMCLNCLEEENEMIHKTGNGWLSGFTPCGLDKMEDSKLEVTTNTEKVTCPKCLKEMEVKECS